MELELRRRLRHNSAGSGWRDPGRLAIALTRSRDDRILAGVCGGIAEWLGWNSTLVRVLYVLVSVLSVAFPGILVYIVLWIVMPEAPSSHKAPTP